MRKVTVVPHDARRCGAGECLLDSQGDGHRGRDRSGRYRPRGPADPEDAATLGSGDQQSCRDNVVDLGSRHEEVAQADQQKKQEAGHARDDAPTWPDRRTIQVNNERAQAHDLPQRGASPDHRQD